MSAGRLVAILGFIGIVVVIPLSYAAANLNPLTTAVLAVSLALGFLTLVSPDIGLGLIIFSSLFSPEIPLFETARRGASVRVEDLVLLSVTLTWLANSAYRKRLAVVTKTPLNKFIWFFVVVCIVSSGQAVASQRIDPISSGLFLLKYLEYYLIFFMVVNHVTSEIQLRRFVMVLTITIVLASMVRWVFIGDVYRIAGPLGRLESGESNTVAAYDVIALCVLAGLWLYAQSISLKLLYGATMLTVVTPFLFTLSRGGYLACVAGWLSLLGFAKERRGTWLVVLGVVVVSALVFLPSTVTERIAYTFQGGGGGVTYTLFGLDLHLEDSAAARVGTYSTIFGRYFSKFPILGAGIAVPTILDSQWARLLTEVGLVGTIAFILMIGRLMMLAKQAASRWSGTEWQGLCVGFCAAIVATLVHSFSAATFILIRPMELFWFLSGLIVASGMIIQRRTVTS